MSSFRILVDADACPVIREVEALAQKYAIPVVLLCDEHHIIHSQYAQVQPISSGADAVDIALMNLCKRNDIVVTQDYGVAAMVLGKGAYALHHTGKRYTDDNIEIMLMERHLARKARRSSGKYHLHGPSKLTEENKRRFSEVLESMIALVHTAGGNAT